MFITDAGQGGYPIVGNRVISIDGIVYTQAVLELGISDSPHMTTSALLPNGMIVDFGNGEEATKLMNSKGETDVR